MPTRRAWVFLGVAFIFYFFGNQTQVGWLFVISSLLAGLLPATWWLNRRMLTALAGSRLVAGETLYEGDETEVTLRLVSNGRFPLAHLRTTEHCPLGENQTIDLFIPAIPKQGKAHFTYDVILYQRGVYQFPPLKVTSQAPFGFFKRTSTLDLPTPTLILPEVRPVQRLQLFDLRRVAELEHPRAGLGMEVIGVRPYMAGDSPRHIDWRSVARRGELVSKEFADEAQPGLTLILDVSPKGWPNVGHKHTPFEWGVKTAVSIAQYAHTNGYPIHLHWDDTALPTPQGAVAWPVFLELMAKVQPVGERPFVKLLQQPTQQTYLAVIMPQPDPASLPALIELNHRRNMQVFLMEPSSFPDGTEGQTAVQFAQELTSHNINVSLIQFGKDWAEQIDAGGRKNHRNDFAKDTYDFGKR